MNVTFLSIKLEARSAVHRSFPRGRRLVDMSYGRIGRWGRSKIRSFTTVEALRPKCMPPCGDARRRHLRRVRSCPTRCPPDLVDHRREVIIEAGSTIWLSMPCCSNTR
jgi:predicted DNA-binding WGR domain protein